MTRYNMCPLMRAVTAWGLYQCIILLYGEHTLCVILLYVVYTCVILLCVVYTPCAILLYGVHVHIYHTSV